MDFLNEGCNERQFVFNCCAHGSQLGWERERQRAADTVRVHIAVHIGASQPPLTCLVVSVLIEPNKTNLIFTPARATS